MYEYILSLVAETHLYSDDHMDGITGEASAGKRGADGVRDRGGNVKFARKFST